MAQVVYIGDEATAAGLRLAGARVVVPDPAGIATALERAAADGAEMILLSAPCAARLPLVDLERLLTREFPLVSIAPDVFGRGIVPDLAHEVRGALGIES